MLPKSFDAIVIGTGQSGPSLAVKLAAEGQKVAVIERARFGGTCVNTGCIPTKTLVASAYAAHIARRAADFGVVVDSQVHVDMKVVMARKDKISGESREGVEAMLVNNGNCAVFRGHATFTSNNHVQVGEDLLTAKQIFINVGGRAAIPNIPGLRNIPYLTNSSLLEIDYLPGHLLVVGGSYIALEFGQMFKRFGSAVTILERGPLLLSREDEDISRRVCDILTNEGIQALLGCEHLSIRKGSDGIEVETGSSRPRRSICWDTSAGGHWPYT